MFANHLQPIICVFSTLNCFIKSFTGLSIYLIASLLLNNPINPLFTAIFAQEFSSNFELFSNDPNVLRNSTEILESRGFLTEIHHPITEDGYILTLIRIVNPYLRTVSKTKKFRSFHDKNDYFNNNNHKNASSLRPILMQHGLVCNSDFWLLSRQTQLLPTGEYINENGTVTDCSGRMSQTVGTSLAMVLSACGYDVWLGNYRGNRYSYEHVLLDSRTDQRYWSFSIDELSRYDLPASILYVLTRTGHSQLGYIGHSMGTTGMFQLLSTKPEYSDYIYPFVALAPVTRVGAIESPIFELGAHVPEIFEYITTARSPLFNVPSPDWGEYDLPLIGKFFCGNSLLKPLCSLFLFIINGFDFDNTDEQLIPQVAGHVPDETSTWILGHFAQRVDRSDFKQFDYGQDVNLKFYGSIVPPTYNLSRITNKFIILVSSTGDWLADPQDVDYLRSQLTVTPWADHVISLQQFNHFDFAVGKDVGTEVNAFLLRSFRQLFS